MYFQSYFREVSDDNLQSAVNRIAKEVGLKYNYLEEEDCLAVVFHHAILNEPANFTKGFFAKLDFEFVFEMSNQLPSTVFWEAFAPVENTVQNFVIVRNEDYKFQIRYDTDMDKEGNFSHDGYYLQITPTATAEDLSLIADRLSTDLPKLYSSEHAGAKLVIAFKGNPELTLEKWDKQKLLDTLSNENWRRITYYCSTIAGLKEVIPEFDLIRSEASEVHFHAVFKDFPSQAITKKWFGKFGPPSYTIAHGKYIEGLNLFEFRGNYPSTGIVRYPVFNKTFNDNSVIGLDVVHRKNRSSIIEVFAFDRNSKGGAKRAKFIQKKLSTKFEKFEGEPWNRFSPS